MYRDLVEMEKRLDWTMTRKRVEVQDALGRVMTVRKTSLYTTRSEQPYIDDAYAAHLLESYGLGPTVAARRYCHP